MTMITIQFDGGGRLAQVIEQICTADIWIILDETAHRSLAAEFKLQFLHEQSETHGFIFMTCCCWLSLLLTFLIDTLLSSSSLVNLIGIYS